MALSEADRAKLWVLADGRCSICKSKVARPGTSGDPTTPVAVEHPMRDGAQDGLALVGRFLDSYDNRILLCEHDSALVRQHRDRFPPAKLASLKAKHEEPPEASVSLTVHTATFMPSSPPYYFLKVRNGDRTAPIQLNRVWFATTPAVDVDNADRPLPTLIAPGDLFETWVPTRRVPTSADIHHLARAELADGSIVQSQPNVDVSPGGQVGGGGQPLTALIESVTAANHANGRLIEKEWDVFISYAHQDRRDFVEPLAVALQQLGLRVWYDGFELRIGDSLRRRIDQGIARSAFGVVVLSPAFIGAKSWTEYEMDGLVRRSVDGGQVLLPIWHRVGADDVAKFSPSLADKVACNTAEAGIDEIARLIDEVVRSATRPETAEAHGADETRQAAAESSPAAQRRTAAENRAPSARADVVLVTVNDAETRALRFELERAGHPGTLHHGDVNSYHLYGPINGAMVAHVQSGMGSTGQSGSTLTVVDAIRELGPGAVLAVGVAFGIDEEKQPIGQLLLSERLTSYEKVKITTGRHGELVVLERGGSAECSARLLGRFRAARLEDLGIDVRAGEVLSGEKLIDNAGFRSALEERFPEAIGGEMEGTGLLAASNRENVEWIVAKAVCDYAANKADNKQERQRIAAASAAKAVVAVLESGGLTNRRRR